MAVYVLLINYSGFQPNECHIQTDPSLFLITLKNAVVSYVNGRYIPSSTSIYNFISNCTTSEDLALIVQTFINSQYPMSWTITPSTVPPMII